jgi:adenine-specific DNA-methyltransferase
MTFETFRVGEKLAFSHANCLAIMKSLADGSVDLIVTSPPYNLGKSYEENQPFDEYLKSHEESIGEMIRILSDKGSLCWQVGNYVKNGEVFPLDIFFYRFFKELGLKLRNRIVWHFEHGLHAKTRFSGRYETILWFTKSENYTFNLDKVRVPSKYPGKTYYKGDKKGKLSGNPLGKNPSDYWKVIESDWDGLVWEIPNVKSNHPEKTDHPCQFPIELVERCVLAISNQGDVVFDPYAGVGSTLIAAIIHERKAIGCEKEMSYFSIGKERIENFLSGKLKVRPLGKPVYKPSVKEKVAQTPAEWSLPV